PHLQAHDERIEPDDHEDEPQRRPGGPRDAPPQDDELEEEDDHHEEGDVIEYAGQPREHIADTVDLDRFDGADPDLGPAGVRGPAVDEHAVDLDGDHRHHHRERDQP